MAKQTNITLSVLGTVREDLYQGTSLQEKEKGSITPGKLADMVVLSDDIFKIRPELIRNVKVETTIVGGKIINGGRPAQ